MQRPLTGVVISLVAGVLLGHFVSLPVGIWLAAGLFCCGGSLLARRFAALWLALLLVTAGAANLTLHRAVICPVDLRTQASTAAELVTLRGEVLNVEFREGVSPRGDATHRAMVQLRTSGLKRSGESWRPVFGDVLAVTRAGEEAALRPGQQIQVFGVLSVPEGAFAPGMFDYRAHLGWRGIHRVIEFEGARDLELLTDAPGSWPDRFQEWGRRALQRGLPVHDDTVPLLWAMVLGWKTSLTDEVAEPFMRSGTLHLFAISGLHVGLIAGILVALLRLVRVPRSGVGLVAVPALWFFVAATGWQPSAVRATIMLSIVILGWSLRRPVNLLNSLSAAGFIILLWDPRQLFHAGFQLSFAVVAAIALVLPPLEKLRQRLLRTDPLLPLELRPRWQQRLDAPVRWVTTSFAVSLAAWLGSLPLIMCYFHLVTPLGLLANVVVVACGSAALASAFGSLLTAPFAPGLNELFNHSAWFFARSMQEISLWFSGLPAAWWYVKAPPVTAIAAYYGALLVVGTGLLMRRPRSCSVLLICLLAIAVGAWRNEHHQTRLTVLPLNGGHAVMLEPAGGETWLIDCGNEGSYQFRIRPFLQSRGINRLDHFVLSHGDVRHVGGASALVEEFRPRQLYAGPQLHRSKVYREVFERLEPAGGEFLVLTNGVRVPPWTILHPSADDQFQRADSGALALLTELGGERLLLAPDLDGVGQQRLLERHPDLRADIMVTSAGTDQQATRTEFLVGVQPASLIFVDARYPAAELATASVRRRLRSDVKTVWFTSDTGTIELRER